MVKVTKKETAIEFIIRIVLAFFIIEATSVFLSAIFPTIFVIQYISNLTGVNNATTAVGIFIGIIVYEIATWIYDEYI